MNIYDSITRFGWSGYAADAAAAGGSVFYVDINSGNAANSAVEGQGASWDKPFSTVNYAISRCSNDAGDIILIAANHAETIADTNDNNVSGTTTDEFCVDKAGITIIGLGVGTRRPKFTLAGATDACIDIRNSNCSMYNLVFYNTIDANVAMMDVQAGAHGFTLDNCMFYASANDAEAAVQIILTTGLTDVTIRGCRFYNVAGGDLSLCSIDCEGAVTRLKLYDNIWRGDWNEHVVDADTAAGYDWEVINNAMNNLDASAGLTLTVHASTTGVCINNLHHGGKDGTAPNATAGMLTAQNYYTNVEAASAAILNPATDS